MGTKLPKLLSIRQASEATGLSKYALWYAITRGHISSDHYQKVDGRYVLTEDFEIRKHGVQNDPFLNALPSELTALGLDKDYRNITERQIKGNKNPVGNTRRVHLRGFEREVQGYTANEIYRLTRVHFNTQKSIREGKAVRAAVALRLARGLDIPVERLLK